MPSDGSLPAASLAEVGTRPFSVYLHVPFCRTRCGYCDFNTYTASELGPGASHDDYVDSVLREMELAARALDGRTPAVSTLFVGGGTPTLLPPAELGRLVAGVRDAFGLAPDAEVTTESNPESIDAAGLAALVEQGFTRISFGMQSASEHVLRVLDRVHTPGRPVEAAREARAAGFSSVNLDLIYGTPGESVDDWRRTLDVALSAEPDHVSAYALSVEDGTRLAADIRRGRLPMTDDDLHAELYEVADAVFTGQGFAAYEVSNWARGAAHECRHNLAYWLGNDWWGFGPGAHSHVGGTRFWNVKHPVAYAGRLAQGESPAYAREVLDAETRRVERVLLELRLARGLPLEVLTSSESGRVDDLVARGLASTGEGMLRLTAAGRLLADGVVRDLLD
ncbi:radical SAM family heme chaperone HemW [Mariniluteicoccus endophyticus]